MFENLNLAAVYGILGFSITYLALESAWHFTACRLHDNNKTLYVQASKSRTYQQPSQIKDKRRISCDHYNRDQKKQGY